MTSTGELSGVSSLSATERRILESYAGGLKRGEIAQGLGMSCRSVSKSLTIAKEKLGARSLAHAAALLPHARDPTEGAAQASGS
jgi:DNA-binding CsgD family transcriptional regulator